jgi:hypothetical protein
MGWALFLRKRNQLLLIKVQLILRECDLKIMDSHRGGSGGMEDTTQDKKLDNKIAVKHAICSGKP